MGSECEESLLGESTESLLDLNFKELNDAEFDIPHMAPPSLESILWDMESEEGSDNLSLQSFQSMNSKFRSMLSHCVLQGISTQVTSASERVRAGLPTVITNSVKYIAVGTSHGYILNFDAQQNLCWCCHDTSEQGAISALAFNLECARLLVGYERGYIQMLDTTNGDVLRRMPDAHAPQTAVLHLKFTFLNNLALVGDSSGCVFSMSFNRRLGVRTWDSKCLFSGARGEVCVFEPLLQGYDLHFLSHNVLIAMATMSKIIVIAIRPRLKVLFSQQLPRISSCLPLISWQLVSVGRTFQPVLAWGRGSELNYTRVVTHGPNNRRIRLSPLRTVQLSYTLMGIHWIGIRHLALLDTSENLHLTEVRTQRELEVIELADVGLVYGSAHFKALAVGGGVSEAFALAGERACYNSVTSRGDQLLVLGTKSVHMIKLRSWPERLGYLSEQGRWAEALNLAAEEGQNKERFTSVLLRDYLMNLNQNRADKESLMAAIKCCVKLNKIDILCNEVWEAICNDKHNQDWYLTLLCDHIINGFLTTLSPSISQVLVSHLENKDMQTLENVLLSLEITCLDLHQVLKLCKQQKLYNAWIHITTKTIGDYASPLTEFLSELTPTNQRLGNTMLVYVSSCLAGLGYPNGTIPKEHVPRVKHDVLRCLETLHSINGTKNEKTYPYLRALLMYNTRECLNVVKLAFTEAEFAGEMGLLQRQRLVQILMQILQPPEFSDNEIMNLTCFICRLVTTNNLNLEDSFLHRIVTSLTHKTETPLKLRDHLEREQAWLEMLNTGHLKHISTQKLLSLALESQCFQVAEYLYEQEQNYAEIISCYLQDPVRKNEVFTYINNHIEDNERLVQKQILDNFTNLVSINSKKTADVVVEHFSDQINQLTDILEKEPNLLFSFLSELINNSDLKLAPSIMERYLELLCVRNKKLVIDYVKDNVFRVERAMEITKRYEVHEATALLLEQQGDWKDALDLLLQHEMIEASVKLCIRGAEHVDPDYAQALWLSLLKHRKSTECVPLRQLLHAAAPHVPPAQLLELVSDAKYGDVKALLEDMLTDYRHDVQTLTTVLKLLSTDIHQALANSLRKNGKGVCISTKQCSLCQKPLSVSKVSEKAIVVWGCGHCFHATCLKSTESDHCCPQCKMKAIFVPPIKHDRVNNSLLKEGGSNIRPDLEGHF